MRRLSIAEILDLQQRLIDVSGGSPGVRDLGALESSANQPVATFRGQDLYPALADKAPALCFFLVKNHPFIDGNKRIGHAAMETFFLLNGKELQCSIDEQEKVMLGLAAGELSREVFTEWVKQHTVPVADQ